VEHITDEQRISRHSVLHVPSPEDLEAGLTKGEAHAKSLQRENTDAKANIQAITAAEKEGGKEGEEGAPLVPKLGLGGADMAGLQLPGSPSQEPQGTPADADADDATSSGDNSAAAAADKAPKSAAFLSAKKKMKVAVIKISVTREFKEAKRARYIHNDPCRESLKSSLRLLILK